MERSKRPVRIDDTIRIHEEHQQRFVVPSIVSTEEALHLADLILSEANELSARADSPINPPNAYSIDQQASMSIDSFEKRAFGLRLLILCDPEVVRDYQQSFPGGLR